MILYCWAMTFVNWLRHDGPVIDGHDYVSVSVDDFGRGMLECRRCGHRSTAW
jgi:hypothetical protein